MINALVRAYAAALRLANPRLAEYSSTETADAFHALLRRARDNSGISGVIGHSLGAFLDLLKNIDLTGPDDGRKPDPVERGKLYIKSAWRGLTKSPLFSLIAILTTAVGVGATSLVFTVVNGVLFSPLPYADSDRLVNVWHDLVNEQQYLPAVNPADFRDFQEMATLFEEFAAGSGNGQVGVAGVLTGNGVPQRVDVTPVTHNFFSMLGIDPVMGRHFQEHEEANNGPRVALISHELWNSRFGSDPTVVGKSMTMDGEPWEIVGVLPAGFRLLLPSEAFLIDHADVWVPLQINYASLPPRNWTYFTVLGKMADGVTLEAAQAEMESIENHLRSTYPEHETAGLEIRIVPFQDDIVKAARNGLLLLLGAVSFVLLIAIANVAHLMMIRGADRERELAIRASLGAGRSTVIGHVLAESLAIGLVGGAIGFAMAVGGLELLETMRPASLPRIDELGVDAGMLLFTLCASLMSAIGFGLWPALKASRTDVNSLLHEGGRGGVSRRARRVRSLLVGAEVAVTLVLLVGAALMIRSFAALREVDPGFDPENVLTFAVTAPRSDYPGGTEVATFYSELQRGIEGINGVEMVGAVSQLPLTGSVPLWPYAHDDASLASQSLTADGRVVSAGYFEATGTRLKEGRFFRAGDEQAGETLVIVDDRLAERAWPGEAAVGKELMLSTDGQWRGRVIGVIEHPRYHDLRSDAREQLYRFHGLSPSRNMSFAVRHSGNPEHVTAQVRRVLGDLNSGLPIDRVRPMTALVEDATAETSFTLMLMSAFGVIALILATVGMYGVISYTVNQRSREFAIRMALGQTQRRVVSSVIASSLKVVGIGMISGVVLASLLGESMEGLLYGVNARDPIVYLAISTVLLATGLAATYLPARRATVEDPASTLRAE